MPFITVSVHSISRDTVSNKLRKEQSIKGIKILGNEFKLSQYANDTNLYCADIASVENALETVENFGILAQFKIEPQKNKSDLLGKWGKK